MLPSISYQNLMVGCWALKLRREVWDFAVTSVRPLCHVSSHLNWLCKWGMGFWAKKLWTPRDFWYVNLPPMQHWQLASGTASCPGWSCSVELLFNTVSCQAASFPVCAAELQSNHPSSAPAILVRSSIHPFNIVWSVSFRFCSFPIYVLVKLHLEPQCFSLHILKL